MVKVTKEGKAIKKKKTSKSKKEEFIYACGRRKEAKARVRLYPKKKGGIFINGEPAEKYFPNIWMKEVYLAPLRTCNVIDRYFISVKVKGSGKMGQLGAVVHGIARVLANFDKKRFHSILRKKGFLTRDSRTKERRKVGTGGKARRKKQSPRR